MAINGMIEDETDELIMQLHPVLQFHPNALQAKVFDLQGHIEICFFRSWQSVEALMIRIPGSRTL